MTNEKPKKVRKMAKKLVELNVHCAYDELVETGGLIGNPRNPNIHPQEQITLLAEVIKFQGWRAPITVSRRSGFIVRGHGRLEAAKSLGMDKVPVDYQDYESEAAEYADLVADNKLQEFSTIDTQVLKELLENIDPNDIDLSLTGFDTDMLNTILEFGEVPPNDPYEEWEGMPAYENNELEYRSIIVHFKDEEAVEAFVNLAGCKITDKTKFIWYPEEAPDKVMDKRYASES